MQITLLEVATWIKDIGTLGVLLIIIWGGWTGKYVWRWQYDKDIADIQERINEYKKDSNEWKTLSLQLLQSNKTSVATGQALAEIASNKIKESK